MADNPPPIPRNRPKSQYVPPPIPTNRPKSSYIAPFASLTSKITSAPKLQQTSSKPAPTPKPRTSWSDDTHTQNHVNSTSSSFSSGEKPKPISAKPSIFSKPHTDNGNMRVTVDTSGASKAMFHAAMDPQKRSKVMTKEQEKDAAKLGWGVTKNAAQNASMDDFKKASQAASKASSGKSASAAFGASLVSSAVKKDKPVMTADQQKQAAKLSFGIGKNIASNITMKDVKRASSFVSVTNNNKQQQSQPITAHRPAPKLPPTARARPKPMATSGSSSTLPPPPSSSQGSVPLQMSSQPRPAPSRSAFTMKPASDQSKNRARPTIIRPGAGSTKSENNNTKKMPPPRPTDGPKKGGAPPRPTSAPTSKQKSKRLAPKEPSLLEKHGLSSLEITPVTTSTPNMDKNLPPRPGPGHPLYKHTVSQPHAIAQYDFEAQDKTDLSFKAEDVIILTKRIDADWYIGRCGNREGMFPAQFVRVVRDIAEDSMSSSSTSSPVSPVASQRITGPRCVAKFEYQSDNWEDLSFPVGATIKLLERVDADWLKGEYNGQSGIFPQGYVDVIEDISMKSPQSPALSLMSSGTMVTALFDFDAEDENELSFKVGDKINVTGQFSDDWLVGTLHGKEGRFPANFVDGAPANTSPTTGTALKSVEPHAFVQYDFVAEGDGELSLKAGETVVLLERVGDEWLKGRYKGREGIFPVSFVEVIIDLPVAAKETQPPTSKESPRGTGLGKARYQFEGEAHEDLSFREGDMIELIKYLNDEWIVGKLRGKTGQFPVNFIEIVKPLPS